ncbi:MAG: phenylalanine--tRNA ligase subunit beta [Eubacteriales bacterium]|nr:phenylalanine--tRNA ligase subunit beta [Eubacteriales bacterium]MDD4389881.1 phenylalanine--tRNA ligase subunit beta [Eubacteriales bacterium]
MLVPIEWIKDYVNIDNISIDKYCESMVMSGSNLETYETFGEDIENIVVGKVISVEKHPNADKLAVCAVDVGRQEPLQVITGAPNVEADAYFPVALDGARIPGPIHGKEKENGGTVIKSGEIRGLASEGMFCSCEELGFGASVVPVAAKEGIWRLEGEYTPGQNIVDALELDVCTIEFEITPNRPDCLSMLGMATETAATFGKKKQLPDTACEEKGTGTASDYVSVEIKRTDLCKRYTARVITDIEVKQSPWWLQKRLMFAGMRPINNIVDITNFVMLEYGQPLHAFDINTVEDKKIIVDAAPSGSKFTTLDGKERILDGDVLMINDTKKPIGIAGIMGGLNSEIEETTKTVILESANFLGDSIRASSKRLGLRTEASSRYEKGIDPNLCEQAADRVCRLIEILGAGNVVKGSVDIYPNIEEAKPHDVRVSRMNAIIGTELTRNQMADILESLEMNVEGDGEIMRVTPPTVRQDLEMEIDFAEEIARIYGYYRLPDTLPKMNTVSKVSESWELRDITRRCMSAMGLNEIQTYSFVSPASVGKIRVPEGSWEYNTLKLLNPLGEDTSAMRTVLTPNMLEVLGRNYSRSIISARAYEIGNVFKSNPSDRENALPQESLSISIGLYGEGESFLTLKGIIEELFETLGLAEAKFVAENNYGAYHPGRCARIFVEGKYVGIMGEIHPEVAEEYDLPKRCYSAELLFGEIEKLSDTEKLYSQIPKFPAVVRDIALVVDEETAVGEIKEAVIQAGGGILESIELFDIYRGAQIGESKKSLAFSLTYRSHEKTLTDGEVQIEHAQILKALSDRYNAVLREM